MTCPRCHAPLPPNAPFCANCGLAVGAPGKGSFWAGVLVALGAAALIVGGLAFSGLLRVRAPSAPPGPIVKAEPTTPLATRAPERKTMPDDIRAWLEHLEETEKRRIDLSQRQIMSLMVEMQRLKASEFTDALSELMGDPFDEGKKDAPSIEKARSIASDVKPAWQDLKTFFESMPPPEACRTIAADYGQTLQETGATVSDILGIVETAQGDPQGAVEKLRGIMKSHKSMIDEPAVRADRGVQAICDEYDTRKWFDIKADVGGGGLFTMPSIPVPGVGL